MKNFGIIILLVFSLNVSYSLDTTGVENVDSSKIETVVSDTNSQNDYEDEKSEADLNAEKNAQWFMYGFFVLGAFLVFWKFKNNK